MTHAYENITLPQTSFAGGKNKDGCTAVMLAAAEGQHELKK